MVIKTVIIDDDSSNVDLLEDAINDINDVELIATFSSGEEFFKVIKKLKFDLCIIDYHLPGMNGYQCVQRIVDKKIILTSPETIPADEAMELENVIDVIKITIPLKKERLVKAVKKVRDELLSERGFVVLRSYPNNVRQLNLEDIVYITRDINDSRIKIVHTRHEQIRTQKYNIDELLSKLPDDKFCQVNRAEIINIDYFHSFKEKDSILLHFIEMKKTIELSLTETFYENFAGKIGIDLD
jgi:DNA-binding LytR/AlgR family response regulator